MFFLQLERKLGDLVKFDLKFSELETRTNAKLSSMKGKSHKEASDLQSSIDQTLENWKVKTDELSIKLTDLGTTMTRELSGLKAKFGKDLLDQEIKINEKFGKTLSDRETELSDKFEEMYEHRIEMNPPVPENSEQHDAFGAGGFETSTMTERM